MVQFSSCAGLVYIYYIHAQPSGESRTFVSSCTEMGSKCEKLRKEIKQNIFPFLLFPIAEEAEPKRKKHGDQAILFPSIPPRHTCIQIHTIKHIVERESLEWDVKQMLQTKLDNFGN